ncbi:hypothetical protein, partial [Pseudomonas sp. AKS31]|uniref:hypothetical protein n=1 Tax=Pseudomonas sp. AKS31 TaxID=2949091 RepID=UPI00202A82DD
QGCQNEKTLKGMALTAGHFFQTPGMPAQKKVTKKACSYVRPARWGSGVLRSDVALQIKSCSRANAHPVEW